MHQLDDKKTRIIKTEKNFVVVKTYDLLNTMFYFQENNWRLLGLIPQDIEKNGKKIECNTLVYGKNINQKWDVLGDEIIKKTG